MTSEMKEDVRGTEVRAGRSMLQHENICIHWSYFPIKIDSLLLELAGVELIRHCCANGSTDFAFYKMSFTFKLLYLFFEMFTCVNSLSVFQVSANKISLYAT